MIGIRTFNRNQLAQFVNDAEFERLPFIPISRHRAASHIANPRAEDDDVLLLVAYDDDVPVGYLGVLPDRIYGDNGPERCGWLSCMWVDEQQRGKRIAQQLLERCFSLWDERILVTEFTAPAKRLYDRSGIFRPLARPTGLRLYIRSDLATILPPKRRLFARAAPLLRAFDRVANALLDVRLRLLRADLEGLSVEYVSRVDEEAEAFILARQQGQVFRRGGAELNWILAHPWIISALEKDTLNSRYHFSSVERLFAFHAIKVRDAQGVLVAFIVLAQRNDAMKMPYAYGDDALVWTVVRAELLRLRISTFTVFHPGVVGRIGVQGSPALHVRPVHREYIVSKRFDALLGPSAPVIQDGDADCSFT